MSSRTFFALIGLGLAGLSAWLDQTYLPRFSQQWRAQNYLETQATVVSSRVGVSVSYTKKDRPRHTYQPEVVYTYRVGAKAYESSRIRYLSTGRGETSAFAVVERFPAQKAALAYVDPENPGQSVLIRNWIAYDGFSFLMLAGVHGLALSCLLASRSWKHGRPVGKRGHLEFMLVNYQNPLSTAMGSFGCLALPLGVLPMLGWLFSNWAFFYLSVGLTLTLAAYLAWESVRSNLDWKQALALNPVAKTLTYKEQTWNWAEVRMVLVAPPALPTNKGSELRWLSLRMEDGTTHPIVSDDNLADLKAMALWLRQKLDLKEVK